jgi:ADP-ribose pyrophosphatase
MVRQIYRGRILDVRVESVTLPNGAAVDLELIRHIGAAAVVPVDDQQRVALIRQFRHAAGAYLWEIPAGLLDRPDEPPLECAARELREETGLAASTFVLLGAYHPTPGYSDEIVRLYLAQGLTAGAHDRGADEVIDEMRWWPLPEALQMILRGETSDGKTVAGLFWAAARLGVGADAVSR